MLNSTILNNYHAQNNFYDNDQTTDPSYSKVFIRIIKFIIFVLCLQAILDYKGEKEVEIEEELLTIEINILPTFLVSREKIA